MEGSRCAFGRRKKRLLAGDEFLMLTQRDALFDGAMTAVNSKLPRPELRVQIYGGIVIKYI